MYKTLFAVALMLAVAAMPVQAQGTDTYECDFILGNGIRPVNPGALTPGLLPGIGGCLLGTIENTGIVSSLDIPAGCDVSANDDGDFLTPYVPVNEGNTVEEGWAVWLNCDLGEISGSGSMTVDF